MKVKLNAITFPTVKVNIEYMESFDPDVRGMNPEEYMIYCARVSSPETRLDHDTAPKLLKYLIDHKHWSPFEMINFSFEVVTARAISAQIMRHRSFSFQEFSQRYARVEKIEPIELRYAHEKDRQSSVEVIAGDNAVVLQEAVDDHSRRSLELYNDLLDNGVATECARMVLPLATQTTVVMNGTLRSWIHFLEQRYDPQAQKEIQEIAVYIREILSIECPWTAQALGWV